MEQPADAGAAEDQDDEPESSAYVEDEEGEALEPPPDSTEKGQADTANP